MLILCNLPAVSSDCWKDIIEENVKAVDRSWSRQSFLWIHILHSGYLAAIVCGVSGSNPLKRTVRARRIVSFLFFPACDRAARGKCRRPASAVVLGYRWEKICLLSKHSGYYSICWMKSIYIMCLVIGLQNLLLPAVAGRCSPGLHTANFNIIIQICLIGVKLVSFIWWTHVKKKEWWGSANSNPPRFDH